MSAYQFILTAGPENPVRATRGMMFASKALEEGHEVSLFLTDDAVYLTNLKLAANVKTPTGDDLMTYLKVVLDSKAPVLVCLPCARTRGIDEAGLPEGWRIEKGVEAIRLSERDFRTWVI